MTSDSMGVLEAHAAHGIDPYIHTPPTHTYVYQL